MCFDLWTSVYCLNRYYDYIVILWFITTWATVIKTFLLWENLVVIVYSEWKFCNHLLTFMSLETPLLFLLLLNSKGEILKNILVVGLFVFFFSNSVIMNGNWVWTFQWTYHSDQKTNLNDSFTNCTDAVLDSTWLHFTRIEDYKLNLSAPPLKISFDLYLI